MDLPLHPDLERFILEQVDGGGYDSPADVVTEALFLLWLHGPGCDRRPAERSAGEPMVQARHRIGAGV